MSSLLLLLCLALGADPSGPADLSGPQQLFLDDIGISEKSQVSRTYHAFTKSPANPVLVPEKPWEGDTVYVYGTVLPAEAGGGYRMWYHSWAEGEYRNLCAESADGLQWTKPNLGLVGYGGSKENNILFRRTKEDHNPQVIYTPWESDPTRRYKLMNWDYGRTPPANVISGYYGATSPDGIHWTDAPKNPVLLDPVGDVGNFTWDALGKRYIGYPKQFNEVRGFRRRCVGFAETQDFEHWPAPALVMEPDEYDDRWATGPVEHTDFYGLCGFAYESMYIGFLWVFHITAEGNDGPIFVKLVSSRDGKTWTRQEGPRTPILPLGPAGAWDDGMIFTTNHPLLEDDIIKLYYGGFDGTHKEANAKGAIGLATLRKDGFASLDAGDEEGSVTTVPMTNPGGTVSINYAAHSGRVRVEVLDEQGAVVEGYSREDCIPLTGDSTNATVQWKSQDRLPQALAQVRLHFVMENASLYAYALEANPEAAMKQARKSAAGRKRRIMYNDDGCDTRPYTTPEEFLALRLNQLINTQVDTISYCTGGGGLFWGHIPQAGEALGEFVTDSDEQYVKDLSAGLHALEKQGTDPLALAVKFGHANGMETFWSCRMNNIEDSFAPWSRSRWKREHPEYLFGVQEDFDKYEMTDPRKWWAALDFAVPEVREHLLNIFQDVFTRYDIDGIEMDWFRHPRFFRETNDDLPATPEHVAMMNDFMRKVRAQADTVGVQRQRPLLVACRVPLSVERSLAIGLDVETWLKEDLVDVLIFGGDLGPMAMAPQLRTMVALAHQYKVPALANICGSGLQPAHTYHTNEAWWGAAMNAWQAGADGIYTFNLFPTEPDERLSRLGSPDTLKGLDKIYAIDAIEPRDFWGFDRAALVVPDRLPIALVPNESVTAILPVGEDIAANAPVGRTVDARLRIRVSTATEGDRLHVSLNDADLGNAIPEAPLSATPVPTWFELAPPVKALRVGDNVLEVRLATPHNDAGSLRMDRLELKVHYVAAVSN